MSEFYDRIESLLKSKGANQKDLAEALGLSSSQVFTNWKLRNSMPAADSVLKMAKYFGTTVEYLVTGQEPSVVEKIPKDLQEIINKYAERR